MSRFPLAALAFLAIAALPATGCGPDCQSACRRLYTTDDGTERYCGISSPTASAAELINDCTADCEYALAIAAEPRESYNPDECQGSSTSIKLEGDKEAAMWMDCIEQTSCEDLDRGCCAPHL